MKISRIDKKIEKKIVIGMIVSTEFLRQIRESVKVDLIRNSGVKVIMKWCLDYFDKFDKAPQAHIQDIYDSNSQTIEPEQLTFISKLLSTLSQDYESLEEDLNVDYLLDESRKFFSLESLRKFRDDITQAIDKRNVEEAESCFQQYQLIDRVPTSGIDPVTDMNAIHDSFNFREETMFSFPSKEPLGQMMNHQFKRESFIAFLAPEKRGKTFWLIELAMRAYRARKNVVFFDAGDMGEKEMILRIQGYVSKKPIHYLAKKKERISIPYLEDGEILYEKKRIKPLEWGDAYKESMKWSKKRQAKNFRLLSYANSTLSPLVIRQELDRLEYFEGIIPDVVVIDYADILVHGGRKSEEFRHQKNEIWKSLRALSQERHCCVITATQADAASYDKANIGLSNFSEDKRQYGHVTVMYGINQTEDEKKKGIIRIVELVIRGGSPFFRQVSVLQCLDICRPYIASYIPEKRIRK